MRLLSLICGDIRFQFKYGFYLIYAIFSVLYILLLFLFPETWRTKASAVMIYSDPAALGLFFMGAIVLLEKSERVLKALAVSPVTATEYILAKVISLTGISVIVSVLLAVVARAENIAFIVISVALTSAIFTLLGLISATKINSLNHYLYLIIPIEIVCMIPPLFFLFYPKEILRLYPLNSAISLISGNSKIPALDITILALFVFILFFFAHRATTKMWKSLGGVKL